MSKAKLSPITPPPMIRKSDVCMLITIILNQLHHLYHSPSISMSIKNYKYRSWISKDSFSVFFGLTIVTYGRLEKLEILIYSKADMFEKADDGMDAGGTSPRKDEVRLYGYRR